jgi:hypothetical protein
MHPAPILCRYTGKEMLAFATRQRKRIKTLNAQPKT